MMPRNGRFVPLTSLVRVKQIQKQAANLARKVGIESPGTNESILTLTFLTFMVFIVALSDK